MRKRKVGSRLAVRGGVVVTSLLVTTGLAAAAASAKVYEVTGGTNQALNVSNLESAINAANAAGGSNTIVLGPGLYAPTSAVNSTAILPEITDSDLTITADHAFQASGSQGTVWSGAGDEVDEALLQVNAGASLTLEGISINSVGVANGANPAIVDNGNLTAYSSSISNNLAETALVVNPGATATLDEVTADNELGNAINNEGGTISLDNATIANNTQGYGIQDDSGTTNAVNTIFALNGGNVNLTNCATPLDQIGTTVGSTGYDVDTDGSCVDTTVDTTSKAGSATAKLKQTVASTVDGGGEVQSAPIPTTATNNPAHGLGNPANCSLTDTRFFVHTGTACDAGSYQANGVQDTTGPTCTNEGTVAATATVPEQNNVLVTDPLSGLGPEPGAVGDAPDVTTSTVDTIGPTTIGNDQADVLDGFTIDTGVLAGTTPFSASGPSTTGVTITAEKNTVSQAAGNTHWSFYATNWAGVTKLCK